MAPTIVQDYQQQLIQTILDLSLRQNWWSSPLNLGGGPGEDGGSGIPIGDIFGQLIQSKVAFDTTEAEILEIPASGTSLVTNLNRIRYRINTLEASGIAASGIVLQHDDAFVDSGVTILNFEGSGVENVASDGPGKVTVTISGTPSHALGSSTHTDVEITSVADNEVLAYDSGSTDWINQTAAEAGLAATGHSHSELWTDVTSYLRTTADRNVIVGSQSVAPDGTLHAYTSSAGTVAADSDYDDFIIENAPIVGMTLLAPDTGSGVITWGFPQDNIYHRLVGTGPSASISGRMTLWVDNEKIVTWGPGASALQQFEQEATISTVAGDLTLDPAVELNILGNTDITGTATLSNYLDIAEISEPGNPATNVYRIYPEADAELYGKNDAGNETLLSLDNLGELENVDLTGEGANDHLAFDGSNWVPSGITAGGVSDHGLLTGLTDDDHAQYLLLAGRSGQLITDDITISGDLSLLKHSLLFGTSGSEDTNLYRQGANELQTDDNFTAVGHVRSNDLIWASAGFAGTKIVARFENFDDTLGISAAAFAVKLSGSEWNAVKWEKEVAWNSGSSAAIKDVSTILSTLSADAELEVMRLTSDGNVGIGTGDPQSLLHASGVGTFNSYLDFQEIATPATPNANFYRVYPKTDGEYYGKNDAGAETLLSLNNLGELENVNLAGETQDDHLAFDGTNWVPSGILAGGVLDHGALTGLADDDHTQYTLATGTRAFTGTVAGITPTADAHLTTKAYVDGGTYFDTSFDHGAMGGLGDDDHAQYALLAGRAGGQILTGGTGAGDDLQLTSNDVVSLNPGSTNVDIGLPFTNNKRLRFWQGDNGTASGVVHLRADFDNFYITNAGGAVVIEQAVDATHALALQEPNSPFARATFWYDGVSAGGTGLWLSGTSGADNINLSLPRPVGSGFVYVRDVGGTVVHSFGSDGSVVLNENSSNSDFRVESDTLQNALLVQGSDGFVGLGVPPLFDLHIDKGTNTNRALLIQAGGTTGLTSAVFFKTSTESSLNFIKGGVIFEDNGIANARGRLHLANNVQANNSSVTVADAKLTIGDTGNVGIGTVVPQTLLHASGVVTINDYTDMQEIAAPGTPASNFFRIYPKTDGEFYGKNDGGVEVLLSLDEINELSDVSVGGATQGELLTYDGAIWVPSGVSGASPTDHGTLTGLSDDDHTQYALLAGRAGGQTLLGGTSGSDKLILSTIATGEVVINEDQEDVDFRVEGNNEENLLFVNAGTGGVGIDTSDPQQKFHIANIAGSGDDRGMEMDGVRPFIFINHTDTAGFGGGLAFLQSDVTELELFYDSNADELLIWDTAGGTARVAFERTGRVGIGTSDPAADLHVLNVASGVAGTITLENTEDSIALQSIFTHSNNVDHGSNISMLRSRGTVGVQTVITSNNLLGSINFVGRDPNSYETGFQILSHSTVPWTESDRGTKLVFQGAPNGVTTLTQYLRFENNEIIFNGTGADVNLRIESDDATDIFFVDAGADSGAGRVGINTNVPGTTFDVASPNTTVARFIETGEALTQIAFINDDDTVYFGMSSDNIFMGGTSGESANNLNVDRVTGQVGIGTTSPALTAKLEVVGEIKASSMDIPGDFTTWMPDAPPPSGYVFVGTEDDEFDDSSFDTGIWSEFDVPATQTVNEVDYGMYLSTTTANNMQGIYQPVPNGQSDWSFTTYVGATHGQADDQKPGILLIEDIDALSTSDCYLWANFRGGAGYGWQAVYHTQYNTHSSDDFNSAADTRPGGMFLRFRLSGTTWHFDWSEDGYHWINDRYTRTERFTIEGVGIGQRVDGDSDWHAPFKFARFNNSSDDDQMLGARVKGWHA